MNRRKSWNVAWLSLFVLSALAGGCEGTIEQPGPCDLSYDLLRHLRVTEVSNPSPVLPGTRFEIHGESFIQGRSCVTPEVALEGTLGGSGVQIVLPLDAEVTSSSTISATLPTASAADLGGGGTFNGALVVGFRSVDTSETFEARLDISFEVIDSLTPQAIEVQSGEVYLNDQMVLIGSGFLSGTEGSSEVAVEGTFTRGGESTTISVRLPAELVDPHDRSRAAFLWSPAIGGLAPGSFEGTVTPENVLFNGERTAGTPVRITAQQQQSVLFSLTPETVSLGQIVRVQGRGFVGSPGGTTIIRLDGTFTPEGGEPEDAEFELVGTWINGETLHYTVSPVVASTAEGDMLQATEFDAARGRFEGSATPVLTLGGAPYEGIGIDHITLTLGPIRQVVWVRFLANFRDSLDLYGLGAVEEVLRQRIVARMQEIYCPADEPDRCVNVQFVTEEPTDFCDVCRAVLDIGGPDPNNVGLFGYDNTGVKDVGNLRLHDHVGGENALGAVDGFAYGGIFMDSFLYWSEHPPFDDRPEHAPPANPIFDEVFDPLRNHEVVAGEYPDGVQGERLEQIERAIDFLANVVADMGAHEFGHTLGLAQPDGPPDQTHNPTPAEGCLMDAEVERPLEERARLGGNPGARFCDESLAYLRRILPMR